MKHKQKELKAEIRKLKVLGVATLLTFAFSLSTVQAQESLNATGGNASGSGGSASYSVGQMVYTTHIGTNGSVAEGVQQPYEISIVTGLEEAREINLSLTAYPNPTTEYLTLSIDDYVQTRYTLFQLSYQLYDMQGELLQSESITGNQTSIFMGNLVPATYFVKVIQGNKEVKTFKIIKN
ncbi:MAG: T9SS type A sorting domain-containing protein [Bacteroidales bacterium]|nr:T9SS type A sorting domain-containing protein [Bacteroidales bacterium]